MSWYLKIHNLHTQNEITLQLPRACVYPLSEEHEWPSIGHECPFFSAISNQHVWYSSTVFLLFLRKKLQLIFCPAMVCNVSMALLLYHQKNSFSLVPTCFCTAAINQSILINYTLKKKQKNPFHSRTENNFAHNKNRIQIRK